MHVTQSLNPDTHVVQDHSRGRRCYLVTSQRFPSHSSDTVETIHTNVWVKSWQSEKITELNHSGDSSLSNATSNTQSYSSNYLNRSRKNFLHSASHFPSGRREEMAGSPKVMCFCLDSLGRKVTQALVQKTILSISLLFQSNSFLSCHEWLPSLVFGYSFRAEVSAS